MTNPIPSHSTTASTQHNTSPQQVLNLLKAGNQRFQSGQMLNRDLMAMAQYSSTTGQHPVAFVLSCIDSRSIPEMIFDQSIGDIFTARVAGNIISDHILASIEYAVIHAGTKLVLVMGHTQCGAVTAACNHGTHTEHLETLLSAIRVCFPPELTPAPQQPATPNTIEMMIKKNVLSTLKQIPERSTPLKKALDKQQILLIGAIHHLASGQVSFFNADNQPL